MTKTVAEAQAILIQLAMKGYSMNEIAKRSGISVYSIRSWARCETPETVGVQVRKYEALRKLLGESI